MEHLTWEELTDYFDKRLDAQRTSVIEAHLAVCGDCADQLEWLSHTTGLLRSDLFVPPPVDVRAASDALFDQMVGEAARSDGNAVPLPTRAAGGSVPGDTRGENSEHGAGERVVIRRTAVPFWRRSAWLAAAAAAVLLLVFLASRLRGDVLVAAVQDRQGQVEIDSPDQGFELAFWGSVLPEGSRIATGSDGTASLVFGDGAVTVLMLADSNLLYTGGTEANGSVSEISLATDIDGDLEVDAQAGVTVRLTTGVGQFVTTGGHFRFHYLEPKIAAVNVVSGTLQISNAYGEFELGEGEEQILDYSEHETQSGEPP